jgi:hypothetical protein
MRSGAQHAEDLGECPGLVRDQVEDAVVDPDVDRSVRDRQGLELASAMAP